jgi:hypothetical protein
MQRSVTTTYLEMTDRAQLRPARPASVDFQLLRAEIPCPELNRFLYTAVGADWCWYTRLSWDYAQWLAYLDRPELETWVAYAGGTPAGYFELERQDGDSVEIAYFGILPHAIGRGGSISPQARERQAGVVRLLLAYGASVTDRDRQGKEVRQAATGKWIRALLREASTG